MYEKIERRNQGRKFKTGISSVRGGGLSAQTVQGQGEEGPAGGRRSDEPELFRGKGYCAWRGD